MGFKFSKKQINVIIFTIVLGFIRLCFAHKEEIPKTVNNTTIINYNLNTTGIDNNVTINQNSNNPMEKDFTTTDLMGLTVQKLQLNQYINRAENWMQLSLLCETTRLEHPNASITECFEIIKMKLKSTK